MGFEANNNNNNKKKNEIWWKKDRVRQRLISTHDLHLFYPIRQANGIFNKSNFFIVTFLAVDFCFSLFRVLIFSLSASVE